MARVVVAPDIHVSSEQRFLLARRGQEKKRVVDAQDFTQFHPEAEREDTQLGLSHTQSSEGEDPGSLRMSDGRGESVNARCPPDKDAEMFFQAEAKFGCFVSSVEAVVCLHCAELHHSVCVFQRVQIRGKSCFMTFRGNERKGELKTNMG